MSQEYERFHELEIINLVSSLPFCIADLDKVMNKNNFRKGDIAYFLDRKEKVPAYQTKYLLTAGVYLGNEELYEQISNKKLLWDMVSFDYLFAGLPFSLNREVIDIVFSIAYDLGLEVQHKGLVVTPDSLTKTFEEYAKDLEEYTGDVPGSELVRVMIQETYPRN